MSCAPNEHTWQPLKRGSKRERCTKCRDTFPCAYACKHADCITATKRELPDWITEVTQ